jgi:glycosyltransferase involved in cell wall biosynthesis
MNPLVSVLIPFYNEEKYIFNSLQSIINQSYKNLEILLIDDGSTDKSIEKINSIKDNRIRLISIGKNIGRASARNIGIEEAKGDFIILMDADDECDSKRIEKQLLAIQKNGLNTVCGSFFKMVSKNINKEKRLPIHHDEIIKGFQRKFNRVTFVAGTMMASCSIFKQFKYRTKFKYFEDWDLLLRLYESNKIKFVNVPETLYTYIIRSKSSRREKDWYDYNVFVRNCQSRRLKGIKEFDSLTEFNLHLNSNLLEKYYYESFKLLISIKRKIERL